MVELPADAVQAMRRFIAKQNGYDDPDMQGTAEDAVGVVYPLIAARVHAEALIQLCEALGEPIETPADRRMEPPYRMTRERALDIARGRTAVWSDLLRRAAVADAEWLAEYRGRAGAAVFDPVAEAVAAERQRIVSEFATVARVADAADGETDAERLLEAARRIGSGYPVRGANTAEAVARLLRFVARFISAAGSVPGVADVDYDETAQTQPDVAEAVAAERQRIIGEFAKAARVVFKAEGETDAQRLLEVAARIADGYRAGGPNTTEATARLLRFVAGFLSAEPASLAAGSVPVATPQEEWRTTTGRPLGREPRSRRPVTRHDCGCVTGWDDVHESCVLTRCERHRVATPTRCESQHPRYGRCQFLAGHTVDHVTDQGADGDDDPGYSWPVATPTEPADPRCPRDGATFEEHFERGVAAGRSEAAEEIIARFAAPGVPLNDYGRGKQDGLQHAARVAAASDEAYDMAFAASASPVSAEQPVATPTGPVTIWNQHTGEYRRSWGDLAADVMGLVDQTLDGEPPIPTGLEAGDG